MWRLLVVLALGACGPKDDDDTGGPSDTPTDSVTDTDTTPTGDGIFTGDPVVSSDAACPLVPVLVATTTSAATLSVTDGDRTWTAPGATAFNLPMLDFVPDATYTFTVTATAGGETETREVSWTAPGLPTDWPIVDNLVASPDTTRLAPGFTFVPLGSPDRAYYLTALDASGVPHWIYVGTSRVDDLDLDNDGNPLFLDASGLHRLDWTCHEFQSFTWDPPPADAPPGAIALPDTLVLHHEVSQLSDGTFLTLTHELVDVADFPTDYTLTDTAPATLDSAVVVRFDESGAILDRISYHDLFDPHRIGYDALNGGEADEKNSFDWVHGNAVQWIEEDDSYVVSARQQDAVMKFDRATLQPQWILGNHDNWGPEWQPYLLTPLGGTGFQYHQHAPVLAPDGSLMLFDNGNVRVSPPEEEPANYLPASRAVQFHVDPVAMTVSTDWDYDETVVGQLFCSAGGSVLRAGDDDVLVTCAYGQNFGTKYNEAVGHGASAVRLIDIDPATGDTLSDLHLYSDLQDNAGGWNSARARRIPAIGPATE